MIPEEFLKYFLPNNPKQNKACQWQKGISAMYEIIHSCIENLNCSYVIAFTYSSIYPIRT